MYEGPQTLPRRCIPYSSEDVKLLFFNRAGNYSHQTISRATADQSSIINEIHSSDGIRMRRQTTHLLSRPKVPQKHSLIIATTDQHVPLWRKAQGVDIIVVPRQWYGIRLAGRSMPQPNRLVVRSRCNHVRIRTPRKRRNASQMSFQRSHVLPVRRVPDLDRAICRGACNPAPVW